MNSAFLEKFPRVTNTLRLSHNLSKTLMDIVSSLLILLFLYTAISKTIEIQSTINVLKKSTIFSDIATQLAWTVVISEYVAVILLFFPRSRRIGLVMSTLLMIFFTSYIIFMMTTLEKLPCVCGGVISDLSWSQHLVFNIIFVFLGASGIWLDKNQRVEVEN